MIIKGVARAGFGTREIGSGKDAMNAAPAANFSGASTSSR
jgi:hypothetical protein